MKIQMISKPVFFLPILLLGFSSIAQPDCSKPSTIIARNQAIRDRTEQYVKLFKASGKADDNPQIRDKYIDIQTSFNSLFTAMKEDRAHLAGKRLICERYGDTLTSLIDRANDLNKEIITIIDMKKPAGVGVSDILNIIDWLFKKFHEGQDAFYNKVKWDDWESLQPKKSN